MTTVGKELQDIIYFSFLFTDSIKKKKFKDHKIKLNEDLMVVLIISARILNQKGRR